MSRVLTVMFMVISTTTVLAADPAPSPNFLLIIGDDQGWTDYGLMGSKVLQTPHLDNLASKGLVFPRGYVPSSLCRPSLATMVTGLFPHQHLIMSNDPPYPPDIPPAERIKHEQYLKDRATMVTQFERSPNLPRLLAEKGYLSHQSGKWWEGNACRCGGFREGMTQGDPTKGGRHGDEGLKIGREGQQPVFAFLDRAKQEAKPFYVWYAPMYDPCRHGDPRRSVRRPCRAPVVRQGVPSVGVLSPSLLALHDRPLPMGRPSCFAALPAPACPRPPSPIPPGHVRIDSMGDRGTSEAVRVASAARPNLLAAWLAGDRPER